VDWSKTRAYGMGYCGVYLNVRGREPEGCVAPDEQRRMRDEIAQALRDWRDPDTGAQVVRTVYSKEEIYQGQYFDQAPDLIVGYAPNYRAWVGGTPLGGATSRSVVMDDKTPWSGDHQMDPSIVPGIFLSNFKCRISNPRLIDIAPTVLQLMGLPASSDMDGHSLL
jgi:predicted AlkP superfamily phosphohydrolase/phosphomutase